jgi:hypothetical protein
MCLHITDSASQTDASRAAAAIQQLKTEDGECLVANAFIGTQTNLAYSGPEDFPGYVTADEAGPNADCLRMFEMSSDIPARLYANLKADKVFPQIRPGARLFFDVRTRECLQAIFQIIGSIGSRPAR